MTKYILAGGNDREEASYADALKQELPENLAELQLLSCFFSAEKGEWVDKFNDWGKWFSQNLGIRRYEVADYNDFEEKLKAADIVYFHGGDSWLLLSSIGKYSDLEHKLADKVVIGSSAGANMLSSHFWSPTYKQHGKGLAIVDANIMVHYGAKEVNGISRTQDDWKDEEQAFFEIIKTSEVLRIPEGTFKVFNKA